MRYISKMRVETVSKTVIYLSQYDIKAALIRYIRDNGVELLGSGVRIGPLNDTGDIEVEVIE
jgi:hypothetical protein